jgi:hypothetical protein
MSHEGPFHQAQGNFRYHRLKPWKVKGSRYLVFTARVDDCVTPADIEVPY